MSFIAKAQGPYAPQICQFVHKHFPRRDSLGAADVVDLIEAEFYGTKQHRYGPKPPVEAQVRIRETIRSYVSRHLPIPIVVPWGSEKPDGSSIDVAELMGVQMLGDLHNRVSAFYSPGTTINVRVEDVSAPHLFHWRADAARAEAARYTDDMRALLEVLESPVSLRPESAKVDEATFNQTADARLPDFLGVLTGVGGNVEKWGWKGGFNQQMVEHYVHLYARMYPHWTRAEHYDLLARYFAGASARIALGLRGDDAWMNGDYLEISFVPAAPGTDGQFGKRTYYRTMPMSYTSNHVAPWRAKGYLSISNEDEVTSKVSAWDSQPADLESEIILLNNPEQVRSVEVRADYLLK